MTTSGLSLCVLSGLHFRYSITFICMYVCVVCLSVCICDYMPGVQVPTEASRGCQVHWNQLQKAVSCLSWALGTKLKPSMEQGPVDPLRRALSSDSPSPHPSSSLSRYFSSVCCSHFLCDVLWLVASLPSMPFFPYWLAYPT